MDSDAEKLMDGIRDVLNLGHNDWNFVKRLDIGVQWVQELKLLEKVA